MSDKNSLAPFLVIGESVVDIVVSATGEANAHAGGSPANVAFGLARLGRPTTLLTSLGDDPHGDILRRHLAGVGVKVSSPGENTRTGTAVARLDAGGAASYTFDITWSLPPALEVSAPLHAHTGSIGAVMEPGATVVAGLIRSLHAAGTVSLDPNVRPALLPDRPAVLRRIDDLLRWSDVVKASEEDLEWLYPGQDPVVAAREWLSEGPSVMIVTRGDAGAVGMCQAGEVAVPATPVRVVDAVGAGDSFMAALLDGLYGAGLLGAANRPRLAAITPQTLEAIVGRSTRAAAITVSRSGAMPPTITELDSPAIAG